MLTLPDQPRFLICRLSAVGDTIHTLPLAVALRREWPSAWIGWVVEPGPSPFVAAHGVIDATFIAPKGFLKSPRRAWQLWRELRATRADVAFDPQSLTKSALCGWMSGARYRIGFAPPQGRELAPWLHTHSVKAQATHVVMRYLELLQPLGRTCTDAETKFQLPHFPAAATKIDQWLHAAGLHQPLAVVNPGAGWDSKVWPAERYALVARQLPLRSVVVWGNTREQRWAEEIVAGAAGNALLAPPTSLPELTELVRRARLFIGSDTGPLHIAAAVGTACAAVYGPTHRDVCGPFGPGHCVLQAAHDTLGSERKTAGLVSPAMLEVTAADLLASCHTILAAPLPRQEQDARPFSPHLATRARGGSSSAVAS
jgi:ADP-heptose:LPS heptosyltransferase